jgi:hypothetical protein
MVEAGVGLQQRIPDRTNAFINAQLTFKHIQGMADEQGDPLHQAKKRGAEGQKGYNCFPLPF